MKDNVKRVFYVRQLAHPCYLEIIAQRPEIRIDKLETRPRTSRRSRFSKQPTPIRSAPRATSCGCVSTPTRELLARMPNLLVVSTGGAGFDTVNVPDCTEAGVLVVNQSGGNADAVASHVLAMAADALEADHPDQPRLAPRHAQ